MKEIRKRTGGARGGWQALAAGALVMAGVSVAAVMAVPTAFAHHSFAGFDKNRKITLKGKVKDWQFTNPHSWLQMIVVENGREVEYGLEGASVNTLARRGWNRATFKPGQQISVVMYPLKNGKKGGAFLSATFADGRTISSGITPN